jgi:DnaK suppressor protein
MAIAWARGGSADGRKEESVAPTRGALGTRTLREFRERLRADRTRLLRTVTTTEEEMETLKFREPGAPIEDAAREDVLGILARLEDQEREELEGIDAADAKLAAGTFGICEGCEGNIPLPRLRVMPAARLCLACQSRREQ